MSVRRTAVLALSPFLVCLAGCQALAPRAPDAQAVSAEVWNEMTGAVLFAGADGDAGPSVTAPALAESGAYRMLEAPRHDAGEIVLLYLPNRLFDLLDIVRARLRVGPGFGFSVRATEWASFTAGTYSSFFLGIPGPRRDRFINWPAGMERIQDAEGHVSPARDLGPHYGIGEFGLGLHLAIIGVDVGVDPWEIVDFLAGILTIDPVSDDL